MAPENNIAATITKASGAVTVIRGDETITLNKGETVLATDTISTQGSAVELTFADGAIAMLSPNTTMTVQEFSFDAAAPSFVLNLAAGAMRSISGEVVAQNPDAFKVVTPQATVGIRGTDFIIKIDANGGETHALLSLSQGHNLTLTGYKGQVFSFSTANQGAFIGADGEGTITPYTFTPQEIEELVDQIAGAIAASEDEYNNNNIHSDGTTETSEVGLELDALLLGSLSDKSLDMLESALADLGIDLLDKGGLSYSDKFGTINLDTRIGSALSHSGLVVSEFTPVDAPGDVAFSPDFISIINSTVTRMTRAVPAGFTEYTAGQQKITVTGDDVTEVISGDIGTLDDAAAVLQASKDIINANNVTTGGVLVGDAAIVKNGILNAGSDTITVLSMDGTGAIYGDVQTTTGGTISYGNDVVAVATTMSGDSAVYGQGGDDILSAEEMTDNAIMSGGDNIDGLSVNRLMGSASMLGGADYDTFDVKAEMSGGLIDVGTGASLVSVATMSGGEIKGNSDVDNITITTMTNGTINADAGDDVVKILDSMTGGTINGGADNDHFIFKSMPTGTADVSGGAGDDTLTITDTISSTTTLVGSEIEFYQINGLSAGTLTGTTGSENISLTTWTGGSIVGGGGTDTITLDNVSSTVRMQGSGISEYTIKNLAGGNVIADISGNSTIVIENWNGGTLSSVDGGEDVNITNAVLGNTTFNVSSGTSTLDLNNGLDASATLTLTGDGVVNVLNNGADLDLSQGTIINASSVIQTVHTVSGDTAQTYGTYKAGDNGASIDVDVLEGYGRIVGGTNADTIGEATFDNNGNMTGGGILTNGILEQITSSSIRTTGGFIDGGDGSDTINIGGTIANGLDGTLTITNNHDDVDYINAVDFDHLLDLSGTGDFVINISGNTFGGMLSFGSSGNIDFTAKTVTDRIMFGNNTNTINIENAHNQLYGGTKEDIININNATAYINTREGADSITIQYAGTVTLGSGSDNDSITIHELYADHNNRNVSSCIEGEGGSDTIIINDFNKGFLFGDSRIAGGFAEVDYITAKITSTVEIGTQHEFDISGMAIINAAGGDVLTLTTDDGVGEVYVTIEQFIPTDNNLIINGTSYDSNYIKNNLNGNQITFTATGKKDLVATFNGITWYAPNPDSTSTYHGDDITPGDYATVTVDQTFIHHTINITNDINLSGDNYISGDVGIIDGGAIITGSDFISGANFDLVRGTIYGDAHSITANATSTNQRPGSNVSENGAGNDTILVASMNANGTIFGDFGKIEAGAQNVYCGNDSIIITGEQSGGTIYGDVKVGDTSYGVSPSGWGADDINIGHLSGGEVFGDTDIIKSGQSGSADTFQIGRMTGGTIYGDARIFGDASSGGNTSNVFSNNAFTIGSMEGGTIYGSAESINNNSSHSPLTGNKFTIQGDMSGGTIYATFKDQNDTSYFGSPQAIFGDEIIINGNMTGGTIYADAENLNDAAKSNYKPDYIIIRGDMTGGTIYTDPKNITSTSGIDSGADRVGIGLRDGAGSSVSSGGTMSGGTIYTGGGNDIIGARAGSSNASFFIFDHLTGTAKIYTQADNDEIVIREVSDGGIYGGEGVDTFYIEEMSGGIIKGEEYSSGDRTYSGDVFNITNLTGGTIYGEDPSAGYNSIEGGADDFNFTTVNGVATVYGAGGNDSIDITDHMTGGIIDAGAGADSITINNLNLGTVRGGADADTMNITSFDYASVYGDGGNDTINITTMSSGSVRGGDGADSITVGGTLAGNIYGEAGADIIKLTNMDGGEVHGGADIDTISISGTLSAGNIYSNSGADNINIATMTGGTIYGSDGVNVSITSMSGGSINAGIGASTIATTITKHNDPANPGEPLASSVEMPSIDLGNDSAADSLTITVDTTISVDYFMKLNNFDFTDGDSLTVSSTGGTTKTYAASTQVATVDANGNIGQVDTLGNIMNGSVSGAAGVALHVDGVTDLVIYFGS